MISTSAVRDSLDLAPPASLYDECFSQMSLLCIWHEMLQKDVVIHLFHKERRSIIISSSLYLPVKRMCQKKTKKSLASICPYLAWKRYVFFVRYVAPLYSLKNLYYNKMSFQEAFFFSRCNAWALFLFLLNAKEYKEFKVRANILYSQRWESFQWWM